MNAIYVKFFKIISKYLKIFGPWAIFWAYGPLLFSNPKIGPGLGKNYSALAHSGPDPKNAFAKARARPGWAGPRPELIPIAINNHFDHVLSMTYEIEQSLM